MLTLSLTVRVAFFLTVCVKGGHVDKPFLKIEKRRVKA